MSIFVTRPFLPPKNKFLEKVTDIFDRGILTNQGPNLRELEEKMRVFLDADNFHYITNGTIALQLALRVLDITEGEVITTPFSYVATVSSILWERCTPVFVDIETDNFTIDVTKIESAITSETRAILPVHVFGYACNIKAIETIAHKHKLKVIYDAAHTFAVRYKGKPLCTYGDVSTLSFHATKLFHTIEGGACVVKDKAVSNRLDLIKRFGHNGDNHLAMGINAKQDEFNAAMGIVNFEYIDQIIAERKLLSETYDSLIALKLRRPKEQKELEYNYAYYPVIFESEKELLAAFDRLNKLDIFPRRYFYPSLNKLSYLSETASCPVAEDISSRIACLPLFNGLKEESVKEICKQL